jgi:hypothetical protein
LLEGDAAHTDRSDRIGGVKVTADSTISGVLTAPAGAKDAFGEQDQAPREQHHAAP